MHLSVYPDATPEPEKAATLRLHRDDCGSIRLTAVDERGKTNPRGNILWIKPDGSIKRCRGVDPDIGFDLDVQGRVKID